MTQEEVLQEVLQHLEDLEIHYMLVGSYASNQYSIPRATFDADVVVDCDEATLTTLILSFSADYYADAESATDALRNRSLCGLVHKPSGFKVDLIFLKDRRYSDYQFKRRKLRPFHGAQRWIATPEDIVLAKLEWSKLGQSERQLSDALAIVKTQRQNLDIPYLKEWATQLGVEEMLDDLLKLAGLHA